jgi:NTE family protein
MQAVFERGITPAHYVGTSMGAVVAACFACGLGYREVLKRIMSISRRDVAVFSPTALLGPFAGSLFEPEPLRRTIEKLVPVDRFEDLEVPLTITSVDTESGELVLFGSGGYGGLSLSEALYASCALPLYYPPAQVGERRLVDGGLRAVLPLDVAGMFDLDLMFAVDVGPALYSDPPERELPFPAMLRRHGEAMRIMMASQTETTVARWRDGRCPLVLVRPVRDREATFALESLVRFVEDGYLAANQALESHLHAGY